jgi:hypothetical protein
LDMCVDVWATRFATKNELFLHKLSVSRHLGYFLYLACLRQVCLAQQVVKKFSD